MSFDQNNPLIPLTQEKFETIKQEFENRSIFRNEPFLKESKCVASMMIRDFYRAEGELIKNVFKQLFKRDMHLEDAHRITRVYIDRVIDQYTLVIDSIPVGKVKINFWPTEDKMEAVTFIPNHSFS
jgi:hypothetical protein